MLKNVVEYFGVSKAVGETLYDDFERALLSTCAASYSQIASHGLLHDSCAEYAYKVVTKSSRISNLICCMTIVSFQVKLVDPGLFFLVNFRCSGA